MADTYSKLYFHIVFAVQGRVNIITNIWKDELYKYISGIVGNKDQKLIQINGMPNHIHVLIRSKPNCNLSDLICDIKSNSAKWVNSKNFVQGKFKWQYGFGAFTVSESHVEKVKQYIINQEEHHKNKTFKEEYLEFLIAYKIDYDEKYIFD